MSRVDATQLETIRDLMLGRGLDALVVPPGVEWFTVEELGGLTGFQHTSISAQLRNLRKKKHGAHIVLRRPRANTDQLVYEYKVSR